MVRVEDIETVTKNYVKKSLMTFLEGGKYTKDKKPLSLKWIISVIKSSGIKREKLEEIFGELKNYGDTRLFKLVLEKCKKDNLF